MGKSAKGRAAPERQRLAQRGARARRVTAGQSIAPLIAEALEAAQIKLLRLDAQQISGCARDEYVPASAALGIEDSLCTAPTQSPAAPLQDAIGDVDAATSTAALDAKRALVTTLTL